MTNDPSAILKDIGKQFGKRVSNVNLFDPNVCMSPRDHERPWEILALPGDVFRRKLNITFGNHKVTFLANGEFTVVQVNENLDVDVCSINRQDKVFELEQSPLSVPSFPSYPVFSRQPDTDLRQLLNSPSLNNALTVLQLLENESLHFYRNGLVLYLQRASREEVMLAVEIACNLTDQLPGVENGRR
jgi:hypothetical protein